MGEREPDAPQVRETFVPVDGARLFVRDVGSGTPIVVVHGGPDFDHCYLLPELDRLAGSFRLVYYDQRGRGLSAAGVSPEDVGIRSDVADLDAVRAHAGVEATAVLGHSWGAVVAMAYAVAHADRVSHLILMNAAPASWDGWQVFRDDLALRRPPEDAARMAEVAGGAAFRRGDLDAEAAYYRAHFRMTLPRPELLERVVGRLRRNFTAGGVLTARAVEERLYAQTCRTPEFDLLPDLRRLAVPTLVLHGENDLIPLAAVAPIAEAIPEARLTVLPGCGHFAFLESPEQVAAEIGSLLATS